MGPAAVHPDPPTPRRLAPLVEPAGELSVAQVERYARHVLLPRLGLTGQRRLRAARVAVVGAGGLGCPVLQYLAAAGIGALTLIDDDLVESSNLQRQVLHGLDDVGRPKAVSAAESLRATGTETELHVVQRRVTAENAVDCCAATTWWWTAPTTSPPATCSMPPPRSSDCRSSGPH